MTDYDSTRGRAWDAVMRPVLAFVAMTELGVGTGGSS